MCIGNIATKMYVIMLVFCMVIFTAKLKMIP
jgi:hypothetical protein